MTDGQGTTTVAGPGRLMSVKHEANVKLLIRSPTTVRTCIDDWSTGVWISDRISTITDAYWFYIHVLCINLILLPVAAKRENIHSSITGSRYRIDKDTSILFWISIFCFNAGRYEPEQYGNLIIKILKNGAGFIVNSTVD